MRKLGISTFIWLFFATTAHSDVSPGVAWPDPAIPIPDSVRAFISSECVEYKGSGEETVDECISSEMYGYRAVVEMLMDEHFGDRAAERYRGCTAGLGKLGGRFHRRKADCVSRAYLIVWRFEFSQETSLPRVRKAENFAPSSTLQSQQALDFAISVIENSYASQL